MENYKINNLNGVFGSFIVFLTLFTLSTLFTNHTQAQTTLISNPYESVVSLTNNSSQTASSNTTCTDLSYDLYQGLSDSSTDKSVLNLQNYLFKLGYLKASPNGYFGPATLLAVKNYQLNNNISNTGRVGPLTRKTIKNDSCKITNNTASIINAIPSVTPKPGRINSSNLTISYPAENSTHLTDTKMRIRWINNANRNIYGLILEDKDGVGVGHITSSISGDNYEWSVGKVYSSRANSEIVVEPGLYRIRLTGSSNVPEQYSGLFTIIGKPLEIVSIMPNTIQSNENSSVVIYGKGFDVTTKVNFDVMNNGRTIKPIFVSSDGKILVFQTNSSVRSGQYWLTVNNQYDSGATSTPSNSVSLLIKD